MEENITGYTEIGSAKFTFNLYEYLLTLVLIEGVFPQEMILQRYNIKMLEGTTSSHLKIYFFSLSLETSVITNELRTYISSYVLGKETDSAKEISSFSAIMFTGTVVDNYFSPARKLDMQSSIDSRGKAIYMRSKEDVDFQTSITSSMSIKLSVQPPSLPGQYSGEIGNLRSILTLSFSSDCSLDDLQDYYLKVYHFFAFVNFRRNITFSEITLATCIDGKTLEPIASYFVAVNQPCTKTHALRTISHNHLKKKISDLFSYLAVIEKQLCFIPKNDDEALILDYDKYMLVSAVFEKCFFELYPYAVRKNYSPEHIDIKKKVVDYLETIIQDSTGVSLHAAQCILSSFKSSGKVPLQNRFMYALEQNKDILASAFSSIKFTPEKISSIARDFSVQRNALDHGEFELISSISVSPYTYAVCLIYIMILKKIDVDINTIRRVILYLFTNYNH